jgi:AraC-like DNA-binding protein
MYDLHYPISDKLKKHIVSYTILKPFEESIKYYAFPQQGVTIAFLQNSNLQFEDDKLSISEGKESMQLLLLGKYLHPLQIEYKKYVPEIAINFSETGANYFFENYFTMYAKNNIQVSNTIENFEKDKLFLVDTLKSIHELENILLSRLSEPSSIENIEQAVQLIKKDNYILTKDLARQVHLSEKTLNRNFKKYVGCTTTQFKKISRFRNTIQSYFESKIKNLTELCFENNYCDSPDFYRQISKISGFKPSDFFRDLTKIGEDNFPYILK